MASTLLLLALLAPPGGPARVLPPELGPRLGAVLHSLAPELELDRAEIGERGVKVRMCGALPARRCFNFELSDPAAGCSGNVAGPWCITAGSPGPPDDALSRLRTALGSMGSERVWAERVFGPGYERRCDPAGPAALALLLLLLPLATGFAFARTLARPRLGRRARGLLLRAAVAVAALGAVAGYRVSLGLWDLLSMLLLLALGALLGARLPPPGSRLRWAGALLAGAGLTVLLLEVGARTVLPAPPAFPPVCDAQLTIRSVIGSDSRCSPLYPALFDDALPSLDAAREVEPFPGEARVLHLGDSMIAEASLTEPGRVVPAALELLQPGVQHLNGGVPSTGPDYHLLMLRGWLDRLKPTTVVVYAFVGNDLIEVDQPYECCGWEPLLRYPEGAAPEARCPVPRPTQSFLAWVARSPAPYPLRVATSASLFARHACAAFARLSGLLGHPMDPELSLRHIGRIYAAMAEDGRRRKVAMLLVVLPFRRALQTSHPRRSRAYRTRGSMIALAKRAGIPTLDAWELFEEAVRREGAGRLFLGEDDPHFSAAGHRLLAEWLAPRIGARARVPEPGEE